LLLISNLLSNAVHYAPVGSRIEVSTAREGDTVVLTVDDAGPGIPPSQRQRAFDRFERLGRQDTEGVGLGLSIVRSVVESHGATIHLLDSPQGGLRVQVRFASPADPAVPLRERQMDMSGAK
jgi:signal transduction histidine kinase